MNVTIAWRGERWWYSTGAEYSPFRTPRLSIGGGGAQLALPGAGGVVVNSSEVPHVEPRGAVELNGLPLSAPTPVRHGDVLTWWTHRLRFENLDAPFEDERAWAAVVARPGDVGTRQVFADALESAGHTVKAEFVRAETRAGEFRFMLPKAFRERLAFTTVERCEPVDCCRTWSELEVTGVPERRRCSVCAKDVRVADSVDKLAKSGRVALRPLEVDALPVQVFTSAVVTDGGSLLLGTRDARGGEHWLFLDRSIRSWQNGLPQQLSFDGEVVQRNSLEQHELLAALVSAQVEPNELVELAAHHVIAVLQSPAYRDAQVREAPARVEARERAEHLERIRTSMREGRTVDAMREHRLLYPNQSLAQTRAALATLINSADE